MTRQEIEALVTGVLWDTSLDENPNRPEWYEKYSYLNKRKYWSRELDWRDTISYEIQECWEDLPIESRIAIYVSADAALQQTKKVANAIKCL